MSRNLFCVVLWTLREPLTMPPLVPDGLNSIHRLLKEALSKVPAVLGPVVVLIRISTTQLDVFLILTCARE